MGAEPLTPEEMSEDPEPFGENIDCRLIWLHDLHKWADELAYSIAPQDQIGEHSSMNNPWENALDVLAGERQAKETVMVDLERSLRAAEGVVTKQDARIEAALEWARSIADDVDVLPLMRALDALRPPPKGEG